MAPSAVSQIETGKRTPSSASVIKLAAALGAEVGDLYPKDQPSLPYEGLARADSEQLHEPSLLDDTQIAGWIRERGAMLGVMSDQEFLEYGRGLDPEEIDEDGNPVDVIRAHEALAQEAAATRKLLWTPKEYMSLGRMLPADPNNPAAEQKWQRHEQLRKLRRELEKRYHSRGLALGNYANALAEEQRAAGKSPGYFVPAAGATGRRERMLEAAFKGQEAG